MKLPALLTAGSLAANAVLLGLLFARPTLAPPAVRKYFTLGAAEEAPTAKPRAAQPAPPPKLWAALGSDDLPTLIARLRAAGFPASVIRQIVSMNLSARYDARMRAIFEPDPNVPFWKQQSPYALSGSKRMEDYAALQRERSKLMRDLFSDEFFATADVSASQRRQYGNLSRAKIDLVSRIEDDYGEMTSAVRSATNGIALPEDREKLALLNREKHADLAAILTPDELADYELRSSPITSMLRSRFNNFTPTESEFRAIFQMQQAMNDRFPYTGGAMNDYQQRQDYMKTLNDQLKGSLGDARYGEFMRETSNEYQTLSRLAQRDSLPTDTAIRAYNVRDSVAQESNRAALQTLAQNARAQIVTLLGPAAGQSYVKMIDNQWLGQVERGSAVSFNGGGGTMSISNGTTMISLGSSPIYRRVPGPMLPRP